MKNGIYRLISGACLLLAATPLLRGATPEGTAFFEKKVRPLLVEHCYKCHATTSEKIKGGLLLDSQAGWMNGGDSGEVIEPGNPETSLFIQAVTYEDPDLQMPPKYQLSEDDINTLKRWVKMGAPDPRTGNAKSPAGPAAINIEEGKQFWAFQPPRPVTPPKVKETAWPSDPLDQFILAKLEDHGLTPVSDADRQTLIRRATFDLTGLPPDPKDILAFVQDPNDDLTAYSKVLDRLLRSPRFGERWGRHWLDVVRYAESMGRTRNYPFPFAWRYRDYVIKAFNTDKPYDEFLTEQLAGDLLEHQSDKDHDENVIATGFLALGAQDLNERNGNKFTMDVVDEQIDVTGRAFMALTTGCARCHDHKFDPIPTSDYYALAGIFKSTELRSGYGSRRGGNQDYFKENLLVTLKTKPPAKAQKEEAQPKRSRANPRMVRARKQVEMLNRKITELTQEGRQIMRRAKASRDDSEIAKAQSRTSDMRQEVDRLKRQVRRLKQQLQSGGKGPKKVSGPYAMGVTEGKPVDCRINIRGDVTNLGSEIDRGFLQVLSTPENSPSIDPKKSGRLELARWMTHPDHPLTARVMANRVWHHLFGRGLVGTVDNFGQTGERPSHPELLDHLALQFMDEGWSVKKLIRNIMLSRTYRLGNSHHEGNDALDPDNQWVWRMNMRRLEVEAMRDAILAASGQLKAEPATASPVQDLPLNEIGRNRILPSAESSNHRSVYLPVLRNYLPDMFEAFDFAEPSSVMGRRDITTVSTQALFMMNNQFVMEQARHSADLLLRRHPTDERQRLRMAYARSLGRLPTESEVNRSLEYIQAIRETDPNLNSPRNAWASFCQALFASAEFRYLR